MGALGEKARLYADLIRLDRPVGWLLLLWPTLWALWIANEGLPSLRLLFVFIAGAFLTRSAGVVVNDLADRDFDPFVARTRTRPLASGRVSAAEAGWVIFVLTLSAFLLVLTTNRLTVLLSLFAVFITALYPFMKRHTHLPQLFLGVAFSWGVPMAFAASINSVPVTAWLILATNMLWVLVYDTLYAMVDREDDIKAGVKSTAILFGKQDRLIIGVIQILFIAALWGLGRRLDFGVAYQASLLVAAGLMACQQVLIRERAPARCFRAFNNNNWVGIAILVGIVLSLR